MSDAKSNGCPKNGGTKRWTTVALAAAFSMVNQSTRRWSTQTFADYSMTLFCPTVDRMPTPVLTVCPACGRSDTTDHLTNQEKQFLLDATSYHELFTELGFLKVVDRILRAYPGTKNRLIVSKTKTVGVGLHDEQAVDKIINETPGLRDFLARCSFLFSARFAFVASAVGQSEPQIQKSLVNCGDCGHNYLVLPFDYYMACS